MKYIPAGEEDPVAIVELTRRNLTVLLAKLDDSASRRAIIDGEQRVMVHAVEDASDPAIVTGQSGSFPIVVINREQLENLVLALDDPDAEKTVWYENYPIKVRAVEDEAHYADRPPGEMLLPSSGRYI